MEPNYPGSMDSYGQIMRNFARRLRHYRRRAGFKSGASFAREIGVLEVTYRTYEAGKAEPSFEMLIRMCARLNITPDDLFVREPAQRELA